MRGCCARRWEGLLGEEVMLHVKKLRLLQKRGDDIPAGKAIEKTRKYLTVVGDAIADVADGTAPGEQLPGGAGRMPSDPAHLHARLWQARSCVCVKEGRCAEAHT